MSIDYLLNKLKPLIPEQVKAWRGARSIADDAMRNLLDQEIQSQARRLLGDLSEKALLSLPPARATGGTFQLGTVYYEAPKYSAGLSPSEILQHTAILGRSGAGKTNIVLGLVEQFTKSRVNWLFLDFKRTARALLPRLRSRIQVFTPGRSLAPLTFNPLVVPPGLESNVYIALVIDLLADAFTLGDGARSLIQKALTAAYASSSAPSLAELIKRVENLPTTGRAQGWKVTALRALESLAFTRVVEHDQHQQAAETEKLLQRPTIIELDGLGQAARNFLAATLVLWLYYVQLTRGRREELSQVIIVEEAHHLLHRGLRSHETPLEMVIRQCRELGIGMVIVDQHPHLLSRAALGNAYTVIALNLRDPTDVNVAAGMLQLDDGDKRILGRLKVGEGVVKKQNGHGAFRVDFPLQPIQKGSVTDNHLQAYLTAKTPRSAWIRDVAAAGPHVPRNPVSDTPLEPTELRLLQDVIDYPDDPVRQRYRRLDLSARLGQRMRARLVDNGWLETDLVPVGRTRTLRLRVTSTGQLALGLVEQPHSRRRAESIAHAFWKQFYAERLKQKGYHVEIEGRLQDGSAVDVLARNAAESVAVEIETGKSDAIGNIRRGLRAKLNRIIVVATDEAALQKLEKQLGRKGLLIQGRVYLVLRDEPFKSTSGFERSAA